MAAEENLVPPAKYIFLIAAGLIILIGVGGALGFSEFSTNFLKALDTMRAHDSGITSQQAGPDGKVWLNLALDMRKDFNATHGVVYWYINVHVTLNSTLVDALNNLNTAESVELRVYELQNASNWITIRDTNITNYLFDIQYGNYSGYTYIHSIGGVVENPGEGIEWLTYLWNYNTAAFELVQVSPNKHYPSHGNQLVLINAKPGVILSDCCSGVGFEQFEDYTGPN